MPNILGVPNPISAIEAGAGNVVGAAASAAGNAAVGVVSSGLNSVMEGLWTFMVTMLGGTFAWIDHLGAPNVDPRTGPLAGVMPIMLWLGGAVLVILCFIQIGRGVLDGGRGFATLLIGIGQYSLITAGGLGFLAVLVTASDALALGLLKGGLNIDNWQGITAQNSVLTNAVHSVGGVGVGVLAIFVLFPAVLGLVVETLVRNASILVLAATIPLLAAGLVQESTTRWFWIGLRWMIALLLMSPALALVIVLGLRTAAGAAGAGGASQGAGTAAVQVLIGLVVLLISLTCPWAMFKLFAFIDPSSVSGGRARGFFGSGSSGGGGSAPATGGTGSDGSDEATSNRFTNALSAGSGMAQDVASSAATAAGGMLDTMGAGHQGSVRDESSKSDKKSKGRDTDPDQSSDGGDDSATDTQPQGPAPADASAPPTQPPGDGGGGGSAGPSPAGAPGGGAPGGGGAGGGGAAGGAGEAAVATEGVEAAAVVVAL